MRLLGRVLPMGRAWRLLIVGLAALSAFVGTGYWMGVEIVQQAGELRETVTAQVQRLMSWLSANGVMPSNAQLSDLGTHALGSLGRVTAAVGSVLGALTSLVLVIVIGVFIAIEPRLYERGLAWVLPAPPRGAFYETADRMGFVMRRLLAGRLVGMAAGGIGHGSGPWNDRKRPRLNSRH